MQDFYKNVSKEQLSQLTGFRAKHTPEQLDVAGLEWNYITSGKGAETLVLLPGGLGAGEAWFKPILALEGEWRIIAPTYPLAQTIDQLVTGVNAILEHERIAHVHILGTSLGGFVAQAFVRKYPERVNELILANTTVPSLEFAKAVQRRTKILAFFPTGLIRRGSRKRIGAYLVAVPEDERAFWEAYFDELLALHWDKARLASQNACIVDFGFNYHFMPNDMKDWNGKILVLESSDDAWSKEQQAALRAAYPTALVHTFQHAGHLSALTRREEYLEVVREFLRGSKTEVGAALNALVTS
jgi:pimeloyl-ACP methyl ester carboxylesterase